MRKRAGLPELALKAGEWEARLRPEIGGCLSALTLRGKPVLRTMDEAADHPLQSSCFPLVPYCNRIAQGRFAFSGRTTQLTPNLPPQPHPLHGLGWLSAWHALRFGGACALLEHDYSGDGEWPWPYCAHQHIALDEAGCTIRLIAENRADEPAQLGLGLHPYFRRAAETRVQFAAQDMLGIDSDFLADGTMHRADALAPWSDGTTLPDTLVDHCFTGWDGEASVSDAIGEISLRSQGTAYCHVYAPPGGKELCIEPVNHSPDALNRTPDVMPLVEPGCVAEIALRIEASA